MDEDDVRTIYDRDYAQNYNQRFLLNDRSKIDADFERETIAQLLNEIGDNPTWLDVACGTGYFLSCFRGVERAGLDISPAMLEVARKANPNISLIQGDYRDKRPQWEGKWNLVSCMWWAYSYVESLAELEKVVENFASWTSDCGICFVPIFHPSELGSGDMKLPYTSKDLGEGGGFYQFEGVIWSWIEEERTKQHLNLVAPHPEYMISLFEIHFEQVEIVKYPKHDRQRMALVARQKKSKHQRLPQKKAGMKFVQLVRLKEWWLYKIAPLLSIACAETLLLQLPPIPATLATLTALLSISSVAAYGYLLNDICDIEADQKANKPNAAANLQPWQRLLFCLLFLGTGFSVPLLTHLSTVPLALLAANYLIPTLYSAPPLRLKERGIWGILSDAAGAHLVPTLFVATAFLSQTPDLPRNALIFTGVAAAHTFFVGLRAILLHQLWDRDNDMNSGISTFATQFQPESVRFWINRLVFPVEIALFGSVAVLLCRSAAILIPVFVAYVILEIARLQVTKMPLDPSPTAGKNIVPHELYEVWLPLALATLLASHDFYYLGFIVLTLVLFFPSVKNRAMGVINVIRMLLTPATFSPSAIASETEEESEMPATNLAPLTPEMQRQLETEGYVVLENFLTPDELENLREFERAHPLPEDMKCDNKPQTVSNSDLPFRKKFSDKFKAIATPKLNTIIPGYRVPFCPWLWKQPNSSDNSWGLHQDPYFTDESRYTSLGVWCPLYDVDTEGGGLFFVKRSHKLTLERSYCYRAFNFNKFYDENALSYIKDNHYLTPVPLKAGQAVLFDKRLLHGSPPNTSNIKRVTATCFIVIPKDAPLYLCYNEIEEGGQTKIYEVDDEFYNRYIWGSSPSGDGVKLIKTDLDTCDPLPPKLLVEKLDYLHAKSSTPRLPEAEQYRQTLLHFREQAEQRFQQLQSQLQTTQGELSQPKSYLQHQPENGEIYLELGKVLENEQKWEEAIAVYRRAIALNPDDVRLHQHLGDALAEIGKIDEASTYYRRVLQLTK